MYLHEHKNWNEFTWEDATVLPVLSELRFAQGKILGTIQDLGFVFESAIELDTISDEIIASSKIEGITLDEEKVRSSVSRQLGLGEYVSTANTHEVDGFVEVMLNVTKCFQDPFSRDRFYSWHAALFPSGYSGLRKIEVGHYRRQGMEVVSGPFGKEKVHYKAPSADRVPSLMDGFITWLNKEAVMEPLIKAGIAHLWFLTIHPFDDGNGRIARALTELLLARSDGSSQRFYSMAGQMLKDREGYYDVLERTQKGTSDITEWLIWFLNTLQESINESEKDIRRVIERAVFWKKLEEVPLNSRQQKMLGMLKMDFEGRLTASKWAKICKVSPDTALRDIQDLIEKEILTQDGKGGRSTGYILTR